MSVTVAELLQDKARQSPSGMLLSMPPDAPVSDAVDLMVKDQISSVIIMEDGKMTGLITLRELLVGLHIRGNDLMHAKCRDVMKTNPPVAKEDDSVDHLRGLMTELHITHVPVVKGETLIGILSFQDIARSALKDVVFENQLLKQYIKNWPA